MKNLQCRLALTCGFLLALLALGTPLQAGINVWTTQGPFGGIVNALAIDPATPSGSGTGTVTNTGISCTSTVGTVSGTCSRIFAAGTTVTITATAAGGSTFITYSGGGCTTSPSCMVTLGAAGTTTTVNAEFGLAGAGEPF